MITDADYMYAIAIALIAWQASILVLDALSGTGLDDFKGIGVPGV